MTHNWGKRMQVLQATLHWMRIAIIPGVPRPKISPPITKISEGVISSAPMGCFWGAVKSNSTKVVAWQQENDTKLRTMTEARLCEFYNSLQCLRWLATVISRWQEPVVHSVLHRHSSRWTMNFAAQKEASIYHSLKVFKCQQQQTSDIFRYLVITVICFYLINLYFIERSSSATCSAWYWSCDL